MYLEQPPTCVQVINALQVGRRQLDVMWTEGRRQPIQVCYIILNRSNLFLELLHYTHTMVLLECFQGGQMGSTDRLLVWFSRVSHLQCSNIEKQMHLSCPAPYLLLV